MRGYVIRGWQKNGLILIAAITSHDALLDRSQYGCRERVCVCVCVCVCVWEREREREMGGENGTRGTEQKAHNVFLGDILFNLVLFFTQTQLCVYRLVPITLHARCLWNCLEDVRVAKLTFYILWTVRRATYWYTWDRPCSNHIVLAARHSIDAWYCMLRVQKWPPDDEKLFVRNMYMIV